MMWRRLANFPAHRSTKASALLLLMTAAAGGCAAPPRSDSLHPLDPSFALTTVRGRGFDLALVMPRTQAPTRDLWVFLEGDGRPWVRSGRRIAADPSPRNAIGFALFASTRGFKAYLGRPCYEGHASDAGCDPSLWTSARYGGEVVDSMRAALAWVVRQAGVQHVVLVGYSGGGTLAYLIAPLIPEVSAVVSIAGNLDVDAWTRAHRFLPLTDSLNPATQPPLDRRVVQIVIQGARDTNVPPPILAAFFARQRPQEVWTYDIDHACCWPRDWSSIAGRIRARVAP